MNLEQTIGLTSVAASSTTAPSLSVTGAQAGNTLIILGAILDDNDPDFTISSVTDNAGNTYSLHQGAGRIGGAGTDKTITFLAYSKLTTGGSLTVSVNLSGASAGNFRYYEIGGMEWSGINTESAEDVNELILMTSTDLSAGPITTGSDDDLIVGVAGASTPDTNLNWASPTSWTNSHRQNNSAATIGLDAGYWLPGSVQSVYTAQWAHDNPVGPHGAGVIVAFSPAVQAEPFVKVEIRAAP